ncbi:hypothetical protein T01_4391 [Trichinella spiralis]|uniref:Uncharacterized protein n=1 Tax=Trichinella spiralis TaxID=6334 RepID=A0A0V1C099_TRISP|nr:hypothetical protein T01_4391 [Trichinella spiralis]
MGSISSLRLLIGIGSNHSFDSAAFRENIVLGCFFGFFNSSCCFRILFGAMIAGVDVAFGFSAVEDCISTVVSFTLLIIDLQTATCFDEQRCQLTVSLPLPAGLFHAAQSKSNNYCFFMLPVLEYFPEKIVDYRGLHTSQLLL